MCPLTCGVAGVLPSRSLVATGGWAGSIRDLPGERIWHVRVRVAAHGLVGDHRGHPVARRERSEGPLPSAVETSHLHDLIVGELSGRGILSAPCERVRAPLAGPRATLPGHV